MKYVPKVCSVCGDSFTPTNGRQKQCTECRYTDCVVCGIRVLIKDVSMPAPKTCPECRRDYNRSVQSRPDVIEKRRRTNLQVYGCEDAGNRPEAKQKRERTNLAKYGVTNTFQTEEARLRSVTAIQENQDKIQAARRATCLQRYGTPELLGDSEFRRKCADRCKQLHGYRYAFENKEIQQKATSSVWSADARSRRRATCIRRYGVSSPLAAEHTLEAAREALFGMYQVNYPGQSQELLERAAKASIEKYGHPYPISGKISKYNRDIKERIENEGISVVLEKAVGRISFDLWLPDNDTVIELNPTYTHNLVGNHWGHGIAMSYHKLRTSIAKDAGLRCIHVFDWDDIDKIILMLKKRKVLYARNTRIAEVDLQTCNDFLNSYHLQGTCKGQTVRYGLFVEDQLVQVMTFGKPRYNRNYQWELLRLCSRSDTSVVGGSSKLFKQFIRNHDPVSIISYSDLSKFSGAVYTNIGMELLHTSSPSIIWSKGSHKITDNMLRQHGFDRLFGANFGKGTSNSSLMIQHGWMPVPDCGQSSYIWEP